MHCEEICFDLEKRQAGTKFLERKKMKECQVLISEHSQPANRALKWNNSLVSTEQGKITSPKAKSCDIISITSGETDDESSETQVQSTSNLLLNDSSPIVISSEDESTTESPPLEDGSKKHSHKTDMPIMKRKAPSSVDADREVDSKKQRSDIGIPSDRRLSPREVRALYEQDKLSRQMRRLLQENEQESSFLDKKFELAQALENILNGSVVRGCRVRIVGSSVNGFGRRTSDCDLCLIVDEAATTIKNNQVTKILFKVKRLLHQTHFVTNLKFIPAKVRILKFEDRNTGMEVDLNVNNVTGVRNTHLMSAYSQCDPRVRPLVLCLKEWAHQNAINDASQGTLSSYALCLMIVHYLQCGPSPSVLPSLQALYPGHFRPGLPVSGLQRLADSIPPFHSPNRQPLSQLLAGFFRYFASFDFQRVMSVRRGDSFFPDGRRNGSWDGRAIRIEEPFDCTNVARAVRDECFPIIVRLLRRASRAMESASDLSAIIRLPASGGYCVT